MNRLLPLTAAVLFALMGAGCQESARETASDVAEARTEAAKDVAEERQDVAEARAEGQAEIAQQTAQGDAGGTTEAVADTIEDVADEQYDVAIAAAAGRKNVAEEQCDANTDLSARDACKDQAEDVYESEKASAKADYERRMADSDRVDEMD